MKQKLLLLGNNPRQSHLFADLQHCNQRVDFTCAVSTDHGQTERPYDLILELVSYPSAYSAASQTHGILDWRDVTSTFYSRPGDSYDCASCAGGARRALPFCTAACKSEYAFVGVLSFMVDQLRSQFASRGWR